MAHCCSRRALASPCALPSSLPAADHLHAVLLPARPSVRPPFRPAVHLSICPPQEPFAILPLLPMCNTVFNDVEQALSLEGGLAVA